MTELTAKRCVPCEGGHPALPAAEVNNLLKKLDAWDVRDNTELLRNFKFRNYYHTMAFVNAVAWIAHQENHHPDLEVGFDHCLIRYSTHAIKGLTENDFICAAKVDKLFAEMKK